MTFLPRGNNNTQATNTSGGNQLGNNTSGNAGINSGVQAGGSNSGVGTNNVAGNSGLGDISASGNAKIDIRIEPNNPLFQNEQLPGYFPAKGFEAQPPQLAEFRGAQIFTRDLLLAGNAEFSSENVVIRGKRYTLLSYFQDASTLDDLRADL